MLFNTLIGLAIAISSVSARATLSRRNTEIYATFYDDSGCNNNGGEPVSTANPGCLNETGRNGIYFQSADTDNAYDLIYSPSSDCPCQSYVFNMIVGSTQLPACVSLEGTPASTSQSFRFIEHDGAPPSNNC